MISHAKLKGMEVESLLHRQGGRCFYCRKQLPLEKASIEHVVPHCLSGANGFNNLAVCCRTMNSYLQGISPKHKIELLLNWWGKSPCPEDICRNQSSSEYRMPIVPTDFGDPGEPVRNSESDFEHDGEDDRAVQAFQEMANQLLK